MRQIIRQKSTTYRQYGGGARRKRRYGKTNHRQNPPAYCQRGGKPKSKRSRRLLSWRGSEAKGENQHEMERWHNLQSREGGEVPSGKRIAERKQSNVHHKENKTKHAVLCHRLSRQITLAAPRLGAEKGVGRTAKKKTNTKNLQSRASV